jgi:aldose 1-epimerase
MQTNFDIIPSTFGRYTTLELKNQVTGEYLSVLPEVGGMLHCLELEFSGKLIPVLDSYKNADELELTLTNTYKGSNLFPFPNRIDGGKYTFEGKENLLDINFPHEKNAIHGLIYNQPFEVSKRKVSEEEAFLELQYISDGKLKGYPYKFELLVQFELNNEGIRVNTIVTNKSDSNIPVGNGWHPYFVLFDKANEAELSFPSKEYYAVNDRMLPTGNTTEYRDFNSIKNLGTIHFDTCFSIDGHGKQVETIIKNKTLHAGLSVWQETGNNKFNYLQIYTPLDRSSIAIEPMTCLPNAFNNGTGYTVLKPKEVFSAAWGVRRLEIK